MFGAEHLFRRFLGATGHDVLRAVTGPGTPFPQKCGAARTILTVRQAGNVAARQPES